MSSITMNLYYTGQNGNAHKRYSQEDEAVSAADVSFIRQ